MNSVTCTTSVMQFNNYLYVYYLILCPRIDKSVSVCYVTHIKSDYLIIIYYVFLQCSGEAAEQVH